MADVKREVRALGQKVAGLKAGDSVTLVLKRPKPKVDVKPAKDAAKLAGEKLTAARNAVATLSRAHDTAATGDAPSARKMLDEAREALDQLENAAHEVQQLV